VEGLLETLIGKHLFPGQGSTDEFLVINVPGPVEVNMLDQLVDLLLIEVDAFDLTEAGNELVTTELAVAILVKALELLLQSLNLILCEKILNEEGVHSLLQTGACMECLEGLHGILKGQAIVISSEGTLEPRMHQSVSRIEAVIRMVSHQFKDQIASLI
jgi:hypothetical protein